MNILGVFFDLKKKCRTHIPHVGLDLNLSQELVLNVVRNKLLKVKKKQSNINAHPSRLKINS